MYLLEKLIKKYFKLLIIKQLNFIKYKLKNKYIFKKIYQIIIILNLTKSYKDISIYIIEFFEKIKIKYN